MILIKQKQATQRNRQQGFVLILALVLLAVMTLIGVSSMNSANMELRATANAQQHQHAFTTGMSVLEYAISANAVREDNGLPPDFQTSDPMAQPIKIKVDGVDIVSEVTYVGCATGVGSSLEEGKGFSYNFYNIEGKGINKGSTATSIQNQGIRYPAAACDK